MGKCVIAKPIPAIAIVRIPQQGICTRATINGRAIKVSTVFQSNHVVTVIGVDILTTKVSIDGVIAKTSANIRVVVAPG